MEVEVEEVVVDTTAPPHHEPAHPGRSAREPLDEKLVRLVRCVRLRPRGPCAAPRRHQRSSLGPLGGEVGQERRLACALPASTPLPRVCGAHLPERNGPRILHVLTVPLLHGRCRQSSLTKCALPPRPTSRLPCGEC